MSLWPRVFAEDRRQTLLRWLLEVTQPGADKLLTPPPAIAEAVVRACLPKGVEGSDLDEFQTGNACKDAVGTCGWRWGGG